MAVRPSVDLSRYRGSEDWASSVGTKGLIPQYSKRREHFERLLAKTEPLKIPLLPLQRKSVANAAALKYHALLDDMGLGKTAQALAVDALGGHRHTLILCPSNVKKVWAAEIEKFTPFRSRDIYVGKGREFLDIPPTVIEHFRYLVFNYEVLNVADKAMGVIPSAWRLCTHHILDEVHAMRNAESKKSMYYELMLRESPPDSLTLLSGTPVDRFIGELYVYLAFLDKNPHAPEVFRHWFPNAISFADRYGLTSDKAGAVGLRNYSGINGMKGVGKELYQLMGPRFCQRKRAEVVQLPKRHDIVIDLPDGAFLGFDMQKVRDDFLKAFWLSAKQGKTRKFFAGATGDDGEEKGLSGDMLFMAQTQKIRKQIATAKIPFSLGQAMSYRQKYGPVIVFSEFLSPLDLFEANAARGGMKCLFAVGQGRMPLWEREENIEAFKKGKADFLLATFGAMSEGENLQVMRTIIFNDQSWQPLVMQQATCRIDRLGQKNETYIVNMLCSADQAILGTLKRKREMIDKFEGLLGVLKKENKLI